MRLNANILLMFPCFKDFFAVVVPISKNTVMKIEIVPFVYTYQHWFVKSIYKIFNWVCRVGRICVYVGVKHLQITRVIEPLGSFLLSKTIVRVVCTGAPAKISCISRA
jgi:hypothetical protein